MVRRHPDLAAALTRPIARTRWGEVPDGQRPWAMVPIFMPGDTGIVTTYVRSAVRKGQALAGVPPVTPEQEAAFDIIDALAADPAFHLDMEFAPGDMQFLNNHVILHSRTTYEDHAEPEKRRHLLRLWLACDDGPPLPKVMVDDAFQGASLGSDLVEPQRHVVEVDVPVPRREAVADGHRFAVGVGNGWAQRVRRRRRLVGQGTEAQLVAVRNLPGGAET